jgi:hypothetical protein
MFKIKFWAKKPPKPKKPNKPKKPFFFVFSKKIWFFPTLLKREHENMIAGSIGEKVDRTRIAAQYVVLPQRLNMDIK